MSAIRRHLVAPVADGRVFRHLGLVASAIPLGVAWLVMLVVGWALGLGLIITLLGIPILVGLAYAVRECARFERGLLDMVVGTRLAGPVRPVWAGSFLSTLARQGSDPRVWREQAYLLLRFVAGVPVAFVVLGVIGFSLQLILAPTYYRVNGALDGNFWNVNTLPEALLLVPLGLALLCLAVPLTGAAGRMWTALAVGVLGSPGGLEHHAARATPPARPTRPVASAVIGVVVVLAVVVMIQIVCVVIWAATTPGDYFWPIWVILPLTAILAIVAIAALTPVIASRAPLRTRILARHAGISAVVCVFLVVVWLLTTPGGYFWPIWPIVVLALAVAIHAAIVQFGPGVQRQMAERIDVLTSTRAAAADAQAAELRRIERDLHDGAQARLVALAMDLGLARERMDTAPEEARTLVAEAHDEAKRALVELRDLARGIHPAVLSDRGLEAAVGSLAATSPIPTEVRMSLDGRLEPAIEAAAYFTVSEALANAAKHSRADAVSVSVVGDGSLVRVSVSDDGVGGADASGDGLTGLRRRLEAHDGTLTVGPGPDGGTTLLAVLPCE